jgi:multicomponent Na+:H+ antiporter subunit D
VLGWRSCATRHGPGRPVHIANHAAAKITLFFCAGAIYVHAHLDRVSQLGRIGRRMPVTMGAFALASLGLAGLPPMGGFMSKWFLVAGAFEAGSWAAGGVLLLSGVLTAGYLFPVAYRAFFRAPAHDGPAGEATPLMVAPLALTALLALALGFGDVFGMHALAVDSAAAVFGGGP